jgi:hypothetical protein
MHLFGPFSLEQSQVFLKGIKRTYSSATASKQGSDKMHGRSEIKFGMALLLSLTMASRGVTIRYPYKF